MDYVKDYPDNQLIREGDICVIHISEHMKYTLKIEADNELQTKFGLIKAKDLLNHPYGHKFDCKRGWVLPLRLTPELWTQLLPHRTQILYQADISMILMQLDIKPGSIVAESGTGSGSLSHAILRACMPHGFLHTFDINESRVNDARKEFHDHGFGNNVRVTLRNVCESGYGDELMGKVDACILDLPQTWLAIEHANKVLKADGSRLCAFSPCIEQVQQNVAKLTELKFKDIVTLECLLRPFEVKTQKLRLWTENILKGLVAIDQTRIENLKNNLNTTKRARISEKFNVSSEPQPTNESFDEDVNSDLLKSALTDPKVNFVPNMLPTKSHLKAQPFDESVSHSGFLTFASKRP